MVAINEELVFMVALAAWICYRVLRGLTYGRTSVSHEILVNLFFFYLCIVVHLTFFPMNIVLYAFDPYDANLVPFTETIRMLHYLDQPRVVENLLGNLVLLAPLGIFIPVLFKQSRQVLRVLGIGLLVSLGIEIFQLVLAVRVFDVDDVLINLLGVLLGFCVFVLASRAPFLYRLLAKFFDAQRPGWKTASAAYGVFTLAAFLCIFTVQITQQTKTENMIMGELSQAHQRLLGTPLFGEFLMVFSQSEGGEKVVEIYRRAFFNRFTLFESHDDLQLDENKYTVSAMSTGHEMNYFAIARSDQAIAAMVSYTQRFPVATIGEYHFSYARLPIDSDRFFSFRFLDPQGIDLGLTMVQ